MRHRDRKRAPSATKLCSWMYPSWFPPLCDGSSPGLDYPAPRSPPLFLLLFGTVFALASGGGDENQTDAEGLLDSAFPGGIRAPTSSSTRELA